MTLYKVLDANLRSMHGGSGRWTPGRWRSVKGPLVPCENGLHLCRIDQIIGWIGPRIWIAETDGEVIDAGNKVVARRARITREVTPTDAAWRRFAADCAEDALPYVRPEDRETLAGVIAVVRAYADGAATDAELSAASAAASSAAASSAARAAASSAARAAVWAATDAAAWSAANAAARARAAQTARLAALLGEDR